jgi:transcription antitermination factor NusG
LSGERVPDRRKTDSEDFVQRPDDMKDLSGTRIAKELDESRREALLSMLHASEERHKRVSSKRAGTLAAGVEVLVTTGPLVGETAVILDADYINNRVLLEFSESSGPKWLSFKHVVTTNKTDP